MTRATDLGPGIEIDGTYRVIQKLGEGGMGAVYLAELIRLPKRVAIKVLHVAADEGAKARFRREAEIAAKVRHPRIVEVLDYNFLADGSPYLVMELLEGRDLRHRLDEGPLPPGEALPILRDAASALERLHAEGIVHRDLKPENIFLAREGDEVRAKVLDFGISKVVGGGTSLTAEQSVLGTPAYMAPEQVTGENASLDARTDQFALAAVAYEMLAGRPAFQGEHVMQLFHQILTAPAPPLDPEGPESPADPVLARALSKDRAERYLNVSAFVLALSEALGVQVARFSSFDSMAATLEAPALARAATPPGGDPAIDRAPRSRGTAWALGLGVSLALAALAFWSMSPSKVLEGVEGGEAIAAVTPDQADDPAAPAADPDPDPDPASDPEPAPPAAPPEPQSVAPTSPSAPPRTPRPEPQAPAEAQARAETSPPRDVTGPAGRKGARPSDGDALARLGQAEAALSRGDADGALRHARASVGKEPSAAARAVLVKAACLKRDLGLAKAMARALRGPELRDARAHCSKLDIAL